MFGIRKVDLGEIVVTGPVACCLGAEGGGPPKAAEPPKAAVD